MTYFNSASSPQWYESVNKISYAFKSNGGTLKLFAQVGSSEVEIIDAQANADAFRLFDGRGATIRFVVTGAAELSVFGL